MLSQLTPEMLSECRAEAIKRLGTDRLGTYTWPQQWSSSACGFPRGVAIQAFWVAPTLVFVADDNTACVFHNGRFVAHCQSPTRDFDIKVRECNLPGAHDTKFWVAQGAEAWQPPVKAK